MVTALDAGSAPYRLPDSPSFLRNQECIPLSAGLEPGFRQGEGAKGFRCGVITRLPFFPGKCYALTTGGQVPGTRRPTFRLGVGLMMPVQRFCAILLIFLAFYAEGRMVEGAGLLNQGTPRSDGCVNTWEQQRVDRAPDAIGSREQDTGWHQAAREQEREPTVPRSSTGGERTGARKKESSGEKVWRSEVLKMLAVGMGIGDVTGGGENQVILVDPSTVYLYRLEGGTMSRVAEYSAGSLELKSVDVAKLRKQGPARIYVSAQNRGTISSFVLEYRNGALVPVVQNLPYFLRVIWYPSKGPIILGQRRGLNKIYEGPMFELADKGDDLEVRGRFGVPLKIRGRFGVPLKIPIFGFTIGDF